MITLSIILAALLVIACLQLVFHTRLNDEDGARIATLEDKNRDLTRRNTELELKSEMDERLILTLAQDIAGANDAARDEVRRQSLVAIHRGADRRYRA